jgi:uncharacterized caspase-like protein
MSNTVVHAFNRRKMLGCLAAAFGAAALPTSRAGAQDKEGRIALVIGNSAYRLAPLKNPVNDAAAMSERLKQLGFSVMFRENTTLPQLLESMREFSVKAAANAVRLVFYAGHGIQSKGRNYLVPVDADVQAEDEISTKSADVGELVDRLGAIKHGVNIVILDACRINPFSSGVIVAPDGRRIQFRGMTPSGLAPVPAPPVGTLVAFSTQPNGVAIDGANETHSIFAKHLLANLDAPGMAVEQLFKRVRSGVLADTQGVQKPWESSSLTGDFCFKNNPAGRCGPPA